MSFHNFSPLSHNLPAGLASQTLYLIALLRNVSIAHTQLVPFSRFWGTYKTCIAYCEGVVFLLKEGGIDYFTKTSVQLYI